MRGSGCVIDKAMYWDMSMLIEVKTKIDGVGVLLRQMNLYREYHKADEYVVWSLDPSDAKYINLLSQQGYRLIIGPLP